MAHARAPGWRWRLVPTTGGGGRHGAEDELVVLLGTSRVRPLVAAAALVPLGVSTKLYSGPLGSWVRDSAGGFFYVMFWVFVVLAVAPRLRSWPVSAAVFLATSALEFLQLWHPPWLTAVRSTFLGHALLGSTFAASDFLYYAAGCFTAHQIARHWPRAAAGGDGR